ncbi:hypothetical protein, partial [Bacillus mobilis]|uniref:hypothetical protein n=1 Tax=Bacillus mobilis TaxID=2026190 RepID=UPI00362FEF38
KRCENERGHIPEPDLNCNKVHAPDYGDDYGKKCVLGLHSFNASALHDMAPLVPMPICERVAPLQRPTVLWPD